MCEQLIEAERILASKKRLLELNPDMFSLWFAVQQWSNIVDELEHGECNV